MQTSLFLQILHLSVCAPLCARLPAPDRRRWHGSTPTLFPPRGRLLPQDVRPVEDSPNAKHGVHGVAEVPRPTPKPSLRRFDPRLPPAPPPPTPRRRVSSPAPPCSLQGQGAAELHVGMRGGGSSRGGRTGDPARRPLSRAGARGAAAAPPPVPRPAAATGPTPAPRCGRPSSDLPGGPAQRSGVPE